MKRIFLIPVFCMAVMACSNKNNTDINASQSVMDSTQFEQAFKTFKETTLTHRRFKHSDIEPLILNLKHNDSFSVKELGKSVQARSIYQVDYGIGAKKVMLWSQMHGNESTATMALFDLFNFLSGKNDEYDSVRSLIHTKTHLSFIPMLNPDGAELFMRRNALGIDINRDARSGTSPEAAILINAAKQNKPEYAFNLHDQQRYYTAGYQKKSATIAFLAPTYNYEREINETRRDAMKLIVGMNDLLQKYIPGGVAKYDDAHEPRGFGDNFQKWGARTILIESGGLPNDPEKQVIRKLNFIIILNALIDIAQDNYQSIDDSKYDSIPDNRLKGSELVIRNIEHKVDSFVYKTDVSIKQHDVDLKDGNFYLQGRIEDVGDLKESYGFEELDADGLIFQEGKVYEKLQENLNSIDFDQAIELLKKGYFAVNIKENPERKFYSLPLIALNKGPVPIGGLFIGMPANFFLRKGEILKYAVVNGYLIDLENPDKREFLQYVR